MKFIPSIDLRDGHCVQLVGGDLTQEKVRLPDAIAQAKAFEADGAEILHVVDLDRALGRGSNLQVVRHILESVRIPVQVGGGIRVFEDIDYLLDCGAAKVVLGTRAVKDLQFLEEAADRYGNRLTIAVDARGDEIVVKGWTEGSGRTLHDFARQVDGLGVGSILYTDVGREGRMQGPNVDNVRKLTSSLKTRVLASGGIRNVADLVELKKAGAWGAVVGMALYTGAIATPAAKEALK